MRRLQLQAHLGQFSENSWSSPVHSLSGATSSGQQVPSLSLWFFWSWITRPCNEQANVEGTVLLHPQLATPVCRWSTGWVHLLSFNFHLGNAQWASFWKFVFQMKIFSWPCIVICRPCHSKAEELEVVEGEAVCRWCSNQGVDGLSCSKCDAHFCRKVRRHFYLIVGNIDSPLQCLNVNLGAGFIKLASASEGNWTCLLCKSAPLEKIRAGLLAPLQVNKSFLRFENC